VKVGVREERSSRDRPYFYFQDISVTNTGLFGVLYLWVRRLGFAFKEDETCVTT